MIMSFTIGNTKTHRHHVKKWQFRQNDMLCSKICPDGKLQLIHARDQFFALQKWLVCSPRIICIQALQQLTMPGGESKELNLEMRCGTPMHGIEHMGCQLTRHR